MGMLRLDEINEQTGLNNNNNNNNNNVYSRRHTQ